MLSLFRKPYNNANVIGKYDHQSYRLFCCEFEHTWEADRFHDPAWFYDGPLRQAFERELAGERMREVLDQCHREFQDCSGGYITCEVLEADLNAKWCPAVNAELLNPAGYCCRVVGWRVGIITHDAEFCVIAIEKLSDVAASAPPGAAPSGPGAVQ